MSSYQTNYTHFHELVDTWAKQAQTIETQVKNLSEKARVLGTANDTPDRRALIDADEQRLHELAAKTKTIIKELKTEMDQRRQQLSRNDLEKIKKVESAMGSALKNYEKVVNDIGKKRQQYQTSTNSTLIDFGNESSTLEEMNQRSQLQQQMRIQNETLAARNEEQYRVEEEINRVQTDVMEINHIMLDIGAIVSEQSPLITNIERSVTTGVDNISAGNEQLKSASRHQRSYRKKLCWLLLILLIIAIIVAIVIIIKFKA